MTQIDTSTEAVEALLDGVTQGPFMTRHLENFGCNIVRYIGGDKFKIERIAKAGSDKVARFFASARELVPALLAERDALKAALADARETALREAADEAYDADSFELANYGGNKIAERILALIDKGESHE